MFYRRSIRPIDPASRDQPAKISDNALLTIAIIVQRLVLVFVIVRLYAEAMRPLRRTAHFAIEDMRTDDFLLRQYSMVVLGWGLWGAVQAIALAAILTYVGRKTRTVGSSVILFVACTIWGWFWMAACTFR